MTGLRKSYGDLQAVRGIDLSVDAGEIFGIIGPDGAGKTSAFNVLGGVTPQTAGRAIMNGQPPRDARHDVGYLTQTFSLYQDLTVEENLQYIGRLRLVPDEEIQTSWPTLPGDVRHGPLYPAAGRASQRRHEAEARSGLRPDRAAANPAPRRTHHRRRPGQPA